MDYENQLKINSLFFDEFHEKMKKVFRKYTKSTIQEPVDSLSKLKHLEKPEFEEKKKEHNNYSHLLTSLKIHAFINMQIHHYFSLNRKETLNISKINLKFLLLNIFETTNEFYKDQHKNSNLGGSRNLDIKCEIHDMNLDYIENNYQILEHIFLVFFFALISKNYLDNANILFDFDDETNDTNNKMIKFSMGFYKNHFLINNKKKVNEVAIYLTDKVFETTDLSEQECLQKIKENLKNYTIFEVALNFILYNMTRIGCQDFQIQDLSTKNEIFTAISFKIPLKFKGGEAKQMEQQKKFENYESNFFKFSNFKFRYKKIKDSKIISVLENCDNLSKNEETNRMKTSDVFPMKNSGQFSHKKVDSENDLSPYPNNRKKRFSEEYIKLDEKKSIKFEKEANMIEKSFEEKKNSFFPGVINFSYHPYIDNNDHFYLNNDNQNNYNDKESEKDFASKVIDSFITTVKFTFFIFLVEFKRSYF